MNYENLIVVAFICAERFVWHWFYLMVYHKYLNYRTALKTDIGAITSASCIRNLYQLYTLQPASSIR